MDLIKEFSRNSPFQPTNDVRRYFVLPEEAGQLCLMSTILGQNRDILFPKLSQELNLVTFSSIAEKYLKSRGYEPYLCTSEEEAREQVETLPDEGKWPCYSFTSDTTGEKDFEEFYTENETLDMVRFSSLGVIKNEPVYEKEKLNYFLERTATLKNSGWEKKDLVDLFYYMIPAFGHKETGKYLDGRM